MKQGKARHDAVVEAVSTAGRSVVIAGCTVVVAVLGLFLTALPYMYGVALSASIAVLVVMFAAITLLPALLSMLGPNVDRLKIPFLGRTLRTTGTYSSDSPAARWSHMVQRHPWAFAIAGTAILLAIAAPALGMRLGFPDAGNDPPSTMTPQDEETRDLVVKLREDVIPSAIADPGVEVEVGGVTAALEDQSEYITGRIPLFISGVLLLSFLLLLGAFHSPLVSLKAGIMNLLSVAAGYGAMAVASSGGAFSELIGIDREVPVAPFLPVMMFAILFGL